MQLANSDGQGTRIDWIDIAKGYGILLVILGHLDVGKIGTWIYTFHMPLFFSCQVVCLALNMTLELL
jgi:uncharacterized membrane protein YcfT